MGRSHAPAWIRSNGAGAANSGTLPMVEMQVASRLGLSRIPHGVPELPHGKRIPGMARLRIRCLTIEVTEGSEEDFEFLLNFFLQGKGI